MIEIPLESGNPEIMKARHVNMTIPMESRWNHCNRNGMPGMAVIVIARKCNGRDIVNGLHVSDVCKL
jgi:hypothetical protein